MCLWLFVEKPFGVSRQLIVPRAKTTVYRCFMLRAWRRLALTRRLNKCRVDSGAGETADADAAVYSVVELLDDRQLEVLVSAVESSGTDGLVGECVLIDDSTHVSPHVTCCRLWRWPSLQHSGELRCLPWCQSSHRHDGVLENCQSVCCHPYHWSCLLLPGENNGRILYCTCISCYSYLCCTALLVHKWVRCDTFYCISDCVSSKDFKWS